MYNRSLATRIKTGKVRLSYCSIWEPKASLAVQGTPGKRRAHLQERIC